MSELAYDVLVNNDNLLSPFYCPSNLIVTDDNENNFHQYKDPTLKPMIREDIYPYILKMMEDAKKEGIFFILDSGYRSYEYQKVLLDKLLAQLGDSAYQKIALPGASEHQTGLAFDVAYYNNGVYSDDVKGDDKEAIWLANNSYRYGFILRYPKGKEHVTGFQYEPWHFRFVGFELAKILFQEDITLEEYYERNKGSSRILL